MRMYTIILLLLLIFSCKERNDPFSVDSFNWEEKIDTIKGIGRVRDLHFNNSHLFVATENNGFYIYDILSEAGVNSIALSNGQFLEQLYHSNEQWNYDKDLRSIYYAEAYDMIFVLDYNNNTYLGYTEFLLNDIDDWEDLSQNSCGPDANARKFFINENGDDPELYILYKCFEGSSQCVNNPYQNVATTGFNPLFGPGNLKEDFQIFEDFSVSTACDGFKINNLSDDTNDMFFDNDNFFIANPTKNTNSFAVYDSDGSLIDEYNTEFSVRSIYSINNIILAGTENGCYITLLDDGGISDISESKLVLAEGSTIYDIFYDGEQLILSCGSNGIFVYDWNGTESAPSESLRIMDSGNTTFDLEGFNYTAVARFYNGMYFVSMEEDGFQIYNID